MIRYIAILWMFLILGPSWAQDRQDIRSKGMCPKTMVVGDAGDCFRCHLPVTFKLRETEPEESYRLPNSDCKVDVVDGRVVKLYWKMTNVSSDAAAEVFRWARTRGVKYVVIEIQSPGGSLFDAWRIVGLMSEFEREGNVVETRSYGFAASAGFLVLASGTKGHRYAAETAHLMWHELFSFALFKIETPSSSEESSRVLRKFQNIAHEWLSKVSKVQKDELDQKVRNKELWISGKEAFEMGFVDHVVGR
ncbi:MAG: ATP-dependent Clp protease proteolytic subunit [Candidatus Methanomethylicaceae archaeon]